ncbi:MAG: cyclic nucleotide-binding domain-containing protein [Acidimicrobiia bacterium]
MTVRFIADLIGEAGVFDGLAAEDLDLVAGCAKNVQFPAGGLLLQEGEHADTFYLIRTGRVGLEVHVPDGGALIIDTLGPGDVVGWSWLFPPYRWSYDARALEDTRTVAFDGACLRGKCDDDPRLGYALMQRFSRVMVSRLQATRLQLLDLYGRHRGT